MKLLTKELRKQIPPLYATEYDPDPTVWAKFFWPWSSWTYYVLEFDGVDILFGWVDGVEFPELGYSSLGEIERLEGPCGLRVERDQYFTPCPLSEVRRAKERIHQRAEDDWVCLCGNDVMASGFHPCTSQGEEVNPTPEEWMTNCYVCAKCGRIINQDTREVVGRRKPCPLESCAYGDDAPAVKSCISCSRPLCSSCGARDEHNRVYCNECFAEVEERALGGGAPEDDTEPPSA